MKPRKLLENIKLLKEKKKLYDDIEKKDKTLDTIIKIYEAAKNSFTDREKEILESYFIKDLILIDTALKIGWSRATIRRDIEKMEKKVKQISRDIDKDIHIKEYL